MLIFKNCGVRLTRKIYKQISAEMLMNKIRILFDAPAENIHTIWKELISKPPEGYEFVINPRRINLGKLSSLRKSRIINFLYKKVFSKFITPISLSQKMLSIPEGVKLIYSPDMIVTKNFPWICDAEEAIVFAGNDELLLERDKKKIENAFQSLNCKKVLAFTNFAKKSLEREFKIDWKNKIEVVHFGAEIPKLKKEKKEGVDIIFVGTSNNKDPMIFNLKGGREAIEAFRIISKKYSNVRMKIISNIPEGIDVNIPKLEILPLMDREKLFELYAKSDIFLFPNYFGLGMSVVEAMGAGLAIISTDMFGLPDGVSEKNGEVVKIKNKGKYEFRGPSISDFKNFGDYIYDNNKEETISQIVKFLEKLIANPLLIKKKGEESRKLYEKEFSIEARNKKLKKIFDKAIQT